MSAERECFKQIDKFVADRMASEKAYRSRGQMLLADSLGEFMNDHPEVITLSWVQARLDDYAPKFFVDVGNPQTDDFASLEKSNPKLSVCLAALTERFHNIADILHHVYGDHVEVQISHAATIVTPWDDFK